MTQWTSFMVEFHIHSSCMVHVTLQLGIKSLQKTRVLGFVVHGLQVYLANLAMTSQNPNVFRTFEQIKYIDLCFMRAFISLIILVKLLITGLSCLISLLVLVRTRPLLILGSLGQRSRSHGHKHKKMVSAHCLENNLSQSFHINFYMLFGLGEDMTPIDLRVYQVKGQGHNGPFFVKQWFPLLILKNVCHRAIMFHVLIGLGDAMIPYEFGFTRLRVKVSRVTCKKYVHMLFDHYLENYL